MASTENVVSSESVARSAGMSARQYVRAYLLLLSPLTLVILANYLFLRSSGELLSASEIAQRQGQGFALYGTATNHNTYQYKLALYRALTPRAVAVGSSRVMQFRSWFFDVPFVTMGGAMNSLREGEALLDSMLAIHQPEVMLLGLDFWWFDSAVPAAADDHTLTGAELHLNKLLFPVESMSEGKFTPAYFARSIWTAAAGACEGCDRLGLNAAVYDEGYAPDGSRYYLGTITGARKSLDYRLETTRRLAARAETGAGGYPLTMPQKADPQRLAQLQRLVARVRERGIAVAVFLPPVAPAVLAEMRKHSSVSALGAEIRQSLPEEVGFYDFSDSASVGKPDDCEFVDGTHGGELVYLKMLAAMAAREPETVGRVASAKSLRVADEVSGFAMVPNGPVVKDLHELDFLGLGCAKQVATR